MFRDCFTKVGEYLVLDTDKLAENHTTLDQEDIEMLLADLQNANDGIWRQKKTS